MKYLKWGLLSIFLIIGLAILYLSIPTVEYKENPEGKPIPLASNWNQDTIQFLKNNLDKAQHVDAFIAVHQGQEIFSFGETEKLINLHSARKPIMSLLIGIARDKGLLDLNETLGDLGISEYNTPLSEQESSATIRDLLMARSGVYLEADAEIKQSRENRPKRDQYKPGEYYFYNNFDFNALGTILKIKTGKRYEECLSEWLAKPLEMQEFYPENIVYGTPFSRSKTLHPAYKTWMSARDLAKIGMLIVNKGIWNGQVIISEQWLKESTEPLHTFSEDNFRWPMDAYGYLWHLDTEQKNIWGSGYGGQYLMIDTSNQIVLVQRHFTGNSLLSQGLYLRKNTQSSQVDLMQIWYALLRNIPK